MVTSMVHDFEFRHMHTVLGENIRLALWPWNPGEIRVYRVMESLEPTFLIKVALLPNLIFRYEMKRWLDPMEILYHIADKAFYFFRERPSLEVDDHIVLGEE